MSDHMQAGLLYYQHPVSRLGVVPQFSLGYNCTCAVAHGLLEVQCCHGNEHAWHQVSRFCFVPAVNCAISSHHSAPIRPYTAGSNRILPNT